MSMADTLVPAQYNKDDRNHGDMMHDFLTDEQYGSGAQFDGSYQSQQTLHPYMPSQVPRGNAASSYQDTQIAQPTVNSGRSLSPSVSSYHDRATPDAYLSDQSYVDYSQYTTPAFIEDPLLDLSNVLNLNGSGELTSFDNAPFSSQDPYATSTNLNVPSNELQAPNFSRPIPGSHLMSPSLTSHSSPVSSSEGTRNPSVVSIPLRNVEPTQPSFPSLMAANVEQQRSIALQQHSPALTGSPAGIFLAEAQVPLTHPSTNPVVRIENFSRGESPSRSDLSRNPSKRSYRSRRSGVHLSPFDAEDTSDDGSDNSAQGGGALGTVHVVSTSQRNEDGSWIPTSSGRAGIDPNERGKLNNDEIPSLEEQQNRRLEEEKKLEVQEWLVKSVDSFPDSPNAKSRRTHSTGRRRARSTNDMFRRQQGLGVHLPQYEDSGIPGPGRYIDVESDEEYEDESEDEHEGPDTPPVDAGIAMSREADSYFSPVDQVPDLAEPPTDDIYQPPTANAAIMCFEQRAKDIETASLAATIGSRRKSESEVGSIFHLGTEKPQANTFSGDKSKDKRERRPSFLENILPKRNSTSGKRKVNHVLPHHQDPTPPLRNPAENAKVAHDPRRSGSWGRPKSPKVDTSAAGLTADGLSPSPSLPQSGTSPLAGMRNAIRRSRSRSDIGIIKSPGLGELMLKHGGPPMVKLATPTNDDDGVSVSRDQEGSGDEDDADGDDAAQDFVTMDLTVRTDPIIPTLEGFRVHAKRLNPRLDEYMVERVAQEQNRRYKRLLESKVKHLKAVEDRKCSSKRCCTALGGEAKILPPRAGAKDSEVPFVGFQIGALSDDENEATEGMIAASFPVGVPIPPVKSLPAEFECPLCFKIKKFYKPSDWTKHVHEDVQPFTCTFPNCGEPKSFKRKADWVRHENERHRQLEFWTCRRGECNHTCYRKDNFVQHLVREHKFQEPKAKVGKSANGNDVPVQSALQNRHLASDDPSEYSDIWAMVEACRHDTTKQPKQEPCRFCGNKCNSWKKLTVHLAKHMEQISMPILSLVEQKQLNSDTIISPVEKPPTSRSRATSAASAGRAPQVAISSPTHYDPGWSGLALSNNNTSAFPPLTHDMVAAGAASAVMHTYPPPQAFPYRSHQQQPIHPQPQPQPQPQQKRTQANAFAPVDNTLGYAGSSYPGAPAPATNHMRVPAARQQAPNRFGPGTGRFVPAITPVSTYGQQVFQSPVDAPNSFQDDFFPANLDGGQGAGFVGDGGGGPFDQSMNANMQYVQGPYQHQQMPPSGAYMGAGQGGYAYQGQ